MGILSFPLSFYFFVVDDFDVKKFCSSLARQQQPTIEKGIRPYNFLKGMRFGAISSTLRPLNIKDEPLGYAKN